ncbi:YrzE family protein [Kocuria massiliensis]|uniref:YrzE family protein n=1 Tax=Kocuria massiliensis TaxID=1926282 RepID=UPI000A1CCF84|nr:YrzE family protein [Kocuria massiliensis]
MSSSRNSPLHDPRDDDFDPNRTIPLDDDRTEVFSRDSTGWIDHDRTEVLDDDRTEVLDHDRTEVLSDDDQATQVLDNGSWTSGSDSANETLPLPAYGEGPNSPGAEKVSGLEYDENSGSNAASRYDADQRTQVLSQADAPYRDYSGANAPGAAPGAQGSYPTGPTPSGYPGNAGSAAGGYAPAPTQGPSGAELRALILRRQKAEYGRIQLLPGLIGWLVATGTAGFLLWLVAALIPAVGATEMPTTVGASLHEIAQGSAGGGVWVLVFAAVYFLSYLIGGFAAGRAGRFAGAKQGIAVWLWQLMGVAVTTVLSLFLPDRVGTSVPLGSIQSLGGDDFLWGLAAAVCALVIGLVAAILGGLWGTRFHRSVDRWGFEGR